MSWKRSRTVVEAIQGQQVTEQDIRGWADEAERGYDVEQLRKRGRKPIGDGAAQGVPARIDATLLDALTERGRCDHVAVRRPSVPTSREGPRLRTPARHRTHGRGPRMLSMPCLSEYLGGLCGAIGPLSQPLRLVLTHPTTPPFGFAPSAQRRRRERGSAGTDRTSCWPFAPGRWLCRAVASR